MIGKTLGHYQIIEKLGAGGMGVVFLANDLSLGRKVALKFLSEELRQDPTAHKRLLREAKAAAALDHPNICSIHEVAEAADQDFIVMEYVEGQNLRNRLLAGPLPINEALQIASDVAEALEEAHDRGIIHRDLKPANIMLTRKGHAKVMDFGLAKHVMPEGGIESQEQTITAMTQAGTTVGTLAYMAPEQLRGGSADARSDIFSFGVVLYEMLSGVHPFKKDTGMDTASAILKENPAPLTERLPDAPVLLQHTLRRMLAKDASHRYGHVHEVRVDLQDLLGETQGPQAEVPKPAAGRAELRPGKGRDRRTAGLLILAALAGAALTAVVLWTSGPVSSGLSGPSLRVRIPLKPAKHLDGGSLPWEAWACLDRPSRTAFTFPPDGKRLIYGAVNDRGFQLYSRALDDVIPTPIAGTEGGCCPFFSPDGQWLGFWADGRLKKVRPAEGRPMTICEVPDKDFSGLVFGVDWAANDTIVFGVHNSGLYRVSAAGGIPQPLTTLDESKGELSHRLPQILPGGKAILFTLMHHLFMWDVSQIVVQSLDTGERKVLIENGADARYVPSGHVVFAREGALLAAPFNLERLQLTAPPTPVLSNVMQAVDPANSVTNSGAAQFAFSDAGLLAFAQGGIRPLIKRHVVWVDRKGGMESIPALESGSWQPKLSLDGKRLAYSDFGIARSIWTYDLERSTPPLRFTLRGYGMWFTWTPDGKRLAFDWSESGMSKIYWQPIDRSQGMERLTDNKEFWWPVSFSPDSKYLAFVTGRTKGVKTDTDIGLLRISDRQVESWISSQYNESHPVFSPDGRLLAYSSDETGRNELYVRPFPGAGETKLISTAGGSEPRWSPKGDEFYYVQPKPPRMMVVKLKRGPTFDFDRPKELFDTSPFATPATINSNYDVAPDGQRFLMVKIEPEESQAVTEMILVTNWFEELKRLCPPGK